MTKRTRRLRRPGPRLLRWPGRAGLFVLLVLSRVPQAQQQFLDQIQSQALTPGLDQLAPPARPSIPQTAAELANPGAFQVFNPAGPAPDSLDQPFQWGKFVFRPHVTYRFLYGNGIQSAPGVRQKTVIQEISPGLLIDLGPHWVLDYTPTLRYYSNTNFQNGLDQSVILRGGVAYENWAFSLSQSYLDSSLPTVQTGTQVNQQSYITEVTASRELTDVVSLSLQADQNFEFAGNAQNGAQSTGTLQNSRTWSTSDFLDFKTGSRFNWGVGGGGGYVSVDTGPNQTFEQLQSRFNWRLTDRISFGANAGAEDRQFQGAQQGDLISPLYGFSVQYQPFDNTRISLTGNRSVSPSLFQSQVVDSTMYDLSLDQRLLGKLHLTLTGTYSTQDYTGTASPTIPAQNPLGTDVTTSFNARLSCPLLHRGTVGLIYEYSHNQSVTVGNYDSTQIGFDVGYSY